MDSKNLLQSPSRQSLFRACKSPMKRIDESRKDKKDSLNSGLAQDLLDAFPKIKENFEIVKKVGEGTFSKVYLAKFRHDSERMFAFKHLVPTSSPARIENELKCLKMLGGQSNVLGVESSLRNDDHIVFMLPYFPHKKFSDTVTRLSVEEIRNYMEQLLIALNHVHKHKIIHRDVKPSNFLYWKEKKKFALIDFGLAMPVPGTSDSFLKDLTSKLTSAYTKVKENTSTTNRKATSTVKGSSSAKCKHPVYGMCSVCKGRSRQVAPRAGTPGFRSPEVLLRYPQQTTAVDMWSAGVILLCMLSRRYPFFKAKEDMEALMQIVVLFGSGKIKKMAESIGKEFSCHPPIENVDSLKVLCQKLARRSCSLHRRRLSEMDPPVHTATVKTAKCATKRKHSELNHSPATSRDGKTHKRHASESAIKKHEWRENGREFDKPSCEKLTINGGVVDENIGTNITELETGRDLLNNSKNGKASRNSELFICTCIPDTAYDLLERLLELQPDKRITAEEGLKHPFICSQ